MQDPTAGQAGSAARSALLAPPPPPGGYPVRAAPSPPESGHGPPVAWSCSGGCPADSSVVDFELFTDPSVFHQLTTQYDSLGVHFDSALVLVAPGYFYQNYPPRSGAAVATADFTQPGGGSGILYFSFPAAEAVRVRTYVTSLSPITLRCFAAGGAELGATVFAGGNTVETQGGVPNQPVEVSAPGIRSCRLEGADNQYGIDDLTVVWEEGESNLTLSCPSTVVRADPAVCTASAPGAFTFEVVGWSFRPAEIDTVLPREDVAPTDTTWSGPMVASGLVRVNALVNGTLDSADASIVVTARDWSMRSIVDSLFEDSPGILGPQPTIQDSLGFTFHEALVVGDSMQRIDSGPSTGIWHFSGLPVRVKSIVSINTLALRNEGPFYNRQFSTRRVHQGELHCAKEEVVSLYLPGARRHEGLGGRTDVNSHVEIYAKTVEELTRQWAEPLVWATAFPAMAVVRDSFHLAGESASFAMHHNGLNPFQPECRLRYFN